MANAARVHAIERGKVIDRYTMVAFGGGAPLHAGRLAEKLGIGRVVVPVGAGVGSAIGFLKAPIAYEVVRSWRVGLAALDPAEANRLLTELAGEARRVVEAGAGGAPLVEARLVDLRYVGQGHELPMSLPERALLKGDLVGLRERFEERYRQIYGLHLPAMAVEIVTWSVTVSTVAAPVGAIAGVETRAAAGARERRSVYEPALGKMVEMPVYVRGELQPGMRIEGPAVIVEDETTTVVPASFDASINGGAYIVMERKRHVR
jgi:N-methylhydantoinase A